MSEKTNKAGIRYRVTENGCHECLAGYRTAKGKWHVDIMVKGRRGLAHRMTWESVRGRIPEGKIIRHTCDNPACINLDHLLLGDHADNVADRVSRGRSAIGTRNGRAKLNDQLAREIFLSKIGNTTLAAIYGVTRRVVYQIKKRICWSKATADLVAPDVAQYEQSEECCHENNVKAERVGFEPTVPFRGTPVFETDSR